MFLQEVWFEKDYNFLANCTKPDYFISAYDKEFCGAADKVGISLSGCLVLFFALRVKVIGLCFSDLIFMLLLFSLVTKK